MFWSFRTWRKIEAFYQFRTVEPKYSFSIMAKRQLNSTEVITESSLEATGLQRLFSFSVLLFCIKDESIVLMFPWEIQLLPSLFPGRESDSTKCEKLGKKKKRHFPPKAASASCQDLITASYKTLIWPSKWSKSPFRAPFSCLNAQQGIGSPAVERLAQLPHLVPLKAGKRWMGRTTRLCLSSCIPAPYNGHSSP